MTHQLNLSKLLKFFEKISPQSVSAIAELYDANAYFKDPFNEVHGQVAILKIFQHMFKQVDAPCFVIKQTVQQDEDVFIVWDFEFRMRGKTQLQFIHGSSHIRFNPAGLVIYHRDYWDAAEELYEKIPLLGNLMRFFKRKARS
jgi:hypothetical protein